VNTEPVTRCGMPSGPTDARVAVRLRVRKPAQVSQLKALPAHIGADLRIALVMNGGVSLTEWVGGSLALPRAANRSIAPIASPGWTVRGGVRQNHSWCQSRRYRPLPGGRDGRNAGLHG
jgi:hypothetical protein